MALCPASPAGPAVDADVVGGAERVELLRLYDLLDASPSLFGGCTNSIGGPCTMGLVGRGVALGRGSVARVTFLGRSTCCRMSPRMAFFCFLSNLQKYTIRSVNLKCYIIYQVISCYLINTELNSNLKNRTMLYIVHIMIYHFWMTVLFTV